jgi:endonuclease I
MRLFFSLLFLFSATQLLVAQAECSGRDVLNQEDFNDDPSISWTAFDISGDDSWDLGGDFNNAFMNGFDPNPPDNALAEEDWLISPVLDMTSTTDIKLTFDYSERFSGTDVQLLYSTDYAGTGSPISATWTLIEFIPDLTSSGSFPPNVVRTIDLSTLTSTTTYIAFKYEAASGMSGDSEAWRFDNICISGGLPNDGGGNNGGGGTCEPVSGDYYSCIEELIDNGANCAEVKTELSSLIDENTVLLYTGSTYDVWDFMCEYDLILNDAGTMTRIWDVFSDNPTGSEPYEYECMDMGGSASGEGQGFNRDHVFPQSWFGGSGTPQRSDVLNLLPSDIFVNQQKGSWQLGEVATASFTAQNGTQVGSSVQGCAGTVFEPIDEYKGDMARMYLYMAARYEDEIAGWESNSSNADDALSGDSYTAYEPCLLNLILKWHKDDPVSQKERDRNEGAFIRQGNRNPFIDHPEYVDLVWGISDGTMITTPCTAIEVKNCDFANDATIIESPTTERAYRVEDNVTFEITIPADDTVTATAGVSITLAVGTVVENGASALFTIDDCDVPATNFRNDAQPTTIVEGRTISSANVPQIVAQPNPFSDQLNIQVELPIEETLNIQVFDALGRQIDAPIQTTILSSGLHTFEWQTSTWTNGLYYIRVQGTDYQQTIPLLKQY